MKKHSFSSFLDGARKEAKELLAKFNARDESRSLLLVDGVKTRHQKSLHSSLSHSLTPPKFRSQHAVYRTRLFWIASGGGTLNYYLKSVKFDAYD